MQDFIFTIGFALSLVSLAVTVFLIILHLKLPNLLKHPGQYVFIQCICQFLYDLHWCISYPGIKIYQKSEVICRIEAFILTGCYNLGMLYVAVLGIELCLKFKFQGSIAYFKRSFLYNVTCISINLAIIVILIIDGEVYITEFNTCSISSLYSDILELVVCGVCSCIMVFSLCYLVLQTKKSSKKVIKNFAFVILFVFLTWIGPSIIDYFTASNKNLYTEDLGYLIGTVSGTCIGLSRIINYKVLRFLKKKSAQIQPLFKRPTHNSFSLDIVQNSLLNGSFFNKCPSLNDFSELYENFSVKVI
jgi:hypothetical protein